MNRKQIKRLRNQIRKISSQVVRDEVLKRKKTLKFAVNKRGYKQNMVHHPCNRCGKLFRPEEVEIDHIESVGIFKVEGPLKNSKYGDCRVLNWQEWMDRLFCSLDNFQILCIRCHQIKGVEFDGDIREWQIEGGNLL